VQEHQPEEDARMDGGRRGKSSVAFIYSMNKVTAMFNLLT
jgi:hypothetical protein